MSKIFKSAVSHREVRIWPTDAGFAIAVLDDVSNESTSTQLAPADAPAIALAILEAAGITAKGFNESSDAEMAAAHLASHVGLERANAKAVADQKVLEAEAFTLCSAAPFTSGVQSFELLSDGAKVQWLSIARAARDLHGGTK